MLPIDVLDVVDGHSEHDFEHLATEVAVEHSLAEHEVVGDGEVPPAFLKGLGGFGGRQVFASVHGAGSLRFRWVHPSLCNTGNLYGKNVFQSALTVL